MDVDEMRSLGIDLLSAADSDDVDTLFAAAQPFAVLMMQYRCAMLEVKTKLEVLDAELSLTGENSVFETIQSRLKHPTSIVDKLKRKGCPLSLKSIEENVNDVAGLRVICSFPEDIYMIADRLCNQDDVTVLRRKDYIANPKPNGYRSLHLLLSIPIFLMEEKKMMKVEVQFRTIAMDFWASLEHKLKYKRDDLQDSEALVAELKECADRISQIDLKMQEIRTRINDELQLEAFGKL